MADFGLYGGGAAGASAYEVYVEVTTARGDPVLSRAEWIDSLVGPAGADFDVAALPWQAGVTYAPRAGVTEGGSAWLALRSTTGERPSDNPDAWGLLVAGIDQALYDDLLAAAEITAAAAQAAAASAAGAADSASDDAAAAALSAAQAGDAAAAAITNADVYASTSAGLAGTALNGQFMVVVGSEIVRYRHDAGPVATEVARYPTASAVSAHTARVDNPHAVTKAQVGLGAVDNTADADKPVSGPQQAALDQKATRLVVPMLAAAITLVVSTGGYAIGGADAGGDLAAPVAGQAWLVPAFGAWRQAEVTRSGVVIGVTGNGSPIYAVPRLDGLTTAEIGVDGGIIAVSGETTAAPETVAAIGEPELRLSGGQITGRVLPQLFLRRSEGVYVPLTCGPRPVELLSAGAESAVISRDGVESSVRWRQTPLGAGETMHLLLMVGQSLAVGYTDATIPDRSPPWRDLVAETAWQFAASDGVQRGPRPFQLSPVYSNRGVVVAGSQLGRLEPLRGAAHAGDHLFAHTTCESAALALVGHHLHHRDQVLAAAIGTGATPIADFGPATPHYQSCTAVITAAADQAALRARALKVWLIWSQGEQDNLDGTGQATYEAAWLAIRDGLSAHAVSEGASFGGAVIQQCLHRPSGVTGMAALAHAGLIAAGEAAGVPPAPMRPGHSGGAHLYPASYLPLGAATAAEIARALEAAAVQAPPHVTAAVLTTATQIDCAVAGGNGALVVDTDTMPADPGGTWGARVINSAGDEVDIASIEILGGASLRITLAGALTIGSPAPRVEFGLDGPANLAAADFARVNLRDTSDYRCPATGQAVSGWMIHHRVDITA
jgi:hypothetical protein